MKLQQLLVGAFALILSLPMAAQMGDGERKSPPATATGTIGDATITIKYSQPAVREREIFGALVPYEKLWRTGANEATTFQTDKDISVGGKKLPAGTYAIFTIPNEKEWVVIFNSVTEQWGSYNYDETKDVIRIKAKAAEHEATENMTFTVDKKGMIHLDWSDTRVSFAVKA